MLKGDTRKQGISQSVKQVRGLNVKLIVIHSALRTLINHVVSA